MTAAMVLLLLMAITSHTAADCDVEGVVYGDGDEVTTLHAADPCISCVCAGDKPACMAVMCAALHCVDPDFEGRNKCCGACISGG